MNLFCFAFLVSPDQWKQDSQLYATLALFRCFQTGDSSSYSVWDAEVNNRGSEKKAKVIQNTEHKCQYVTDGMEESWETHGMLQFIRAVYLVT